MVWEKRVGIRKRETRCTAAAADDPVHAVFSTRRTLLSCRRQQQQEVQPVSRLRLCWFTPLFLWTLKRRHICALLPLIPIPDKRRGKQEERRRGGGAAGARVCCVCDDGAICVSCLDQTFPQQTRVSLFSITHPSSLSDPLSLIVHTSLEHHVGHPVDQVTPVTLSTRIPACEPQQRQQHVYHDNGRQSHGRRGG